MGATAGPSLLLDRPGSFGHSLFRLALCAERPLAGRLRRVEGAGERDLALRIEREIIAGSHLAAFEAERRELRLVVAHVGADGNAARHRTVRTALDLDIELARAAAFPGTEPVARELLALAGL